MNSNRMERVNSEIEKAILPYLVFYSQPILNVIGTTYQSIFRVGECTFHGVGCMFRAVEYTFRAAKCKTDTLFSYFSNSFPHIFITAIITPLRQPTNYQQYFSWKSCNLECSPNGVVASHVETRLYYSKVFDIGYIVINL